MSGRYIFPSSLLSGDFLPLSGGTVTGLTTFTSGVSGSTMSGGSIYSGSTDLSLIFAPISISGISYTTRVIDGINTFTGGTANAPTVNVTGLSIDNITVSGESSFQDISATTIYSGSSDIGDIFSLKADENSFVNGIFNISGNTFGLGGVLTQNTTISGGTNNLTFGNSDSPVGIFNVFTNQSAFVESNVSITDSSSQMFVFGGVAGFRTYSGASQTHTTSLEVGDVFGDSGMITMRDDIGEFGARYFTDYSANGLANPRWIPDVSAVETMISTGSTNNSTRVQDGINTFTGGTANAPTVNVTGLSIDNITVSGESSFQGVSANTFYSGSTDVEDVIRAIASETELSDITRVQPGINTFTGGTANEPTINVSGLSIDNITVSGEASFQGLSATTIYSGSSDLSDIFLFNNNLLSPTQVAYADSNGNLKGEAGFTYDESNNELSVERLVIGDMSTTAETTATVYGNILLIGDAVSGFTSELFIEDNRIELNYNPTASTVATSLGSGFSIQDGTGVDGVDAFFDVRGTSTGIYNRSLTTNLTEIRIAESGTTSSPNGRRLIAEGDIINGGSF